MTPQNPPSPGTHAVVVGASVGGLLAARALVAHFASVTLVERDDLPDAADHRRGVPQSRHAHGLLGQGRVVLERLFPGLTSELEADGATRGDLGAQAQWYHGDAHHELHESGVVGLFVSRPLLELHLRRRVLAHPNVRLATRASVVGLLPARDGSIWGVAVQDERGAQTHVRTDLVVDASGRGSHLPAWLEAIGFPRPAEERVAADLRYTTRLYRDDASCPRDVHAVVQAGTVESPRGGALLRVEGGRWILSMGGYDGDHAPVDDAGMLAFARGMGARAFAEVIARGEALTPAATYRFASSLRRRYERLGRFPAGLLVFGDAMCSFNPVYGQGITVAAMEAEALGEELTRGRRGRPGGRVGRRLARRFFRRAARLIDTPWTIVTGTDARILGGPGSGSAASRALGAYLDRLHVAARADARVADAFLRVANLMAPPSTLLAPAVAWRVWRATRSARA